MVIYFTYIFLGLLPSLIWLFYYLKKDIHPEPKLMVLKTFIYGMLITLPTFFLEKGLLNVFNYLEKLKISPIIITFLNVFIAIALVEELLKYLIIREKILKNPEFDEPIDTMIYMIIAALGFAGAENILTLASLGAHFSWSDILTLNILRFWGAIFLHVLCSGLLGFFLALSFFKIKKGKKYFLCGFILAVSLHGLYNWFIMKEALISIIIILISLALFLGLAFKKIKKLKSTCQI